MDDRLMELQEALGDLCNKFSKLETALGSCVGFMANKLEARIGLIIVAELSFKARLAAFSSLYVERARSGFDEAPLKEFSSEAQQLEEQRNTLIHSFYWPPPVGDNKATRVKFTAKLKGLRIQFKDPGCKGHRKGFRCSPVEAGCREDLRRHRRPE